MQIRQPQYLAPAGQSWAEAGSGVTARNWSSPASSGTGAEPQGLGPKTRGAACWTAPGHGSRKAGTVASFMPADRTSCRPRPCCPAGAGRACSPVLRGGAAPSARPPSSSPSAAKPEAVRQSTLIIKTSPAVPPSQPSSRPSSAGWAGSQRKG